MVHLIKIEIGMNIIDHHITYCIDFGEFRINRLFTGVQRKNSYTLQPTESNYTHASV